MGADCVPATDWVATARKTAPAADLTGGRVDVFDETPPPRSGAEAFEAVFAFDFKSYIEKKGFYIFLEAETRVGKYLVFAGLIQKKQSSQIRIRW